MCLADVNQRQHHEDKALQHHNQNVEDGPNCACQHVSKECKGSTQGQGSSTTQQGDQHEHQFTCVHVAEQSHAVRDGLGDELDDLHGEVDRVEQRMAAERRGEEFVHPAADALDLDVVVEAEQQHADGQAQRSGQVRSGDDAHVGVGRIAAASGIDAFPDARQQIDRQQVHRIHQEDPDEHGQRQRRDKGAVAVENAFDLIVDKIKQHTRNYAKRQMTWFKNQDAFEWFYGTDFEGVKAYIVSKLL